MKDGIAKLLLSEYVLGLLQPFQTMIACPEIKQKQPQDRKTSFETLSLPVAKILSPVARQAPTKCMHTNRSCVQISQGIPTAERHSVSKVFTNNKSEV